MHAKSSMESHTFLDVRENSLEGICRVGDIESRMIEIHEEVWKISLHTVVGAPKSSMRVVPSLPALIDCPLLQKLPPFVMPEFQPVRELRFADLRKKFHQCLEILSGVELRSPRDVPCDDHGLMKLAHLDRHGKSLQQATPAVTDDGSNLRSSGLQCLDAVLVGTDGFVWEEFPQKILVTMGTAPHHDAEEPLEVGRVHDDDDLVGCEFLLLDHDVLQLSLHPLRTTSVLLCDLCVRLFAVGELMPNLPRTRRSFLTEFFAACFTLPNLPTVVCSKLLEIG